MNNEEKILEILSQIQKDQSAMKDDISGLKTDVSGMKTEISEMKSDMSEVKQRVRSIEVAQETTVATRLQLLAEGQTTIQEQIRQISVIDRMEDDIATLKNAVRYLSDKVEKLESAM